jgi:hypothetical protein
MSMLVALLENTRRFADTFDSGHLPTPPARRVAVVHFLPFTDLDARPRAVRSGPETTA